jgi:TonB family protein
MKLAFLLLVGAVAALQPQTFPSGNVTQPAVTHKVEPEYTKEATEAKLAGVVILATVVGIDGLPSEIKVVRGLGKGLDEKAVECLQQWRFKPGTRDGEPVSVKATVEINFRLH